MPIDFSELTGKGVKVAVVDSGINHWHSHVGKIEGGVGLDINESREIIFSEDIYDSIGHGTACAGIIRTIAPNVQLYSIKIFWKRLVTYSELLINAINWAIENKMDIVNLSLGTHRKEHISEIQKICNIAYQNKTIIVAASMDNGSESYPAIFHNVIGVTADTRCDEDAYFYCDKHKVHFFAYGFPRPLPGILQEHNFRGSSFACAYITGIVARILEKYPFVDFEEVKRILISNSSNIRHCEEEDDPCTNKVMITKSVGGNALI